MVGRIYFGTRDKMMWVKDPAINVGAPKVGWSNQTNFLNGGANVRRSWASHKEFSMSWNLTTRDRLRPIQDFADGIYGTGPIYWLNPMHMDRNLLPSYWGAPFLGALDGPTLAGTDSRPALAQTPSNTLDYPTQGATYTIAAGAKPSIWVPVPPGFTLWVGAHGTSGTGGTVVATPSTGPASNGTPVTLTLLGVNTSTRVNQSFDGAQFGGVSLALGGTGTITLFALIVQVLPTGTTPVAGNFISGQGQSGCTFLEQPDMTEYSSVFDKIGMTATLVETEAWL